MSIFTAAAVNLCFTRLTSPKIRSTLIKATLLIQRHSAAKNGEVHFESGDVGRSVALHPAFPQPDLCREIRRQFHGFARSRRTAPGRTRRSFSGGGRN